MPVILCTGYSELINEEKVKAMGICEYLMKPVSKNDLATAIRMALG
jgi:CheY-like chemotaxis protein